MGFIIYIISNSIALWLAQRFVSGFYVTGGLKYYIIAGTLLGVLNLIVRPILRLISLPLMILTLGMFNLIISALLIWLVAHFTGYIVISNIHALLLATLVFAVVNSISHLFSKAI